MRRQRGCKLTSIRTSPSMFSKMDRVDRAERLLDCLPLHYVQRLSVAFQALDFNRNGFLVLNDFCNGFNVWRRIGLDVNDRKAAYTLFQYLDAEAHDRVCLERFVRFCSQQLFDLIETDQWKHALQAVWTRTASRSNGGKRARDLKKSLMLDKSSPLFGFISALDDVIAPQRVFQSFDDFGRDATAVICFEVANSINLSKSPELRAISKRDDITALKKIHFAARASLRSLRFPMQCNLSLCARLVNTISCLELDGKKASASLQTKQRVSCRNRKMQAILERYCAR